MRIPVIARIVAQSVRIATAKPIGGAF